MCADKDEVVCLAEGRKKEKWSSDPRNTFWSNDKTRLGYRLLEQMGWTDGKGLGAKEDGQKEHVKVAKKSDNSGFGAGTDRDSDWIACQDSFNDILSQLNDSQNTTTPPNSSDTKDLVSAAGKSRKLVYHKFLKSKDLSMKSENDMDCVFGKRHKKRKRTKSENESEEKEPQEQQKEATVSCLIPTIKSELSLQDYFSEKMKKLKSKEQNSDKNNTSASSEQEAPEKHSKKKKKKHKL
ncbi:PREDICTED: PIN2/TERF1-interacting telomerase inhibitor 1-like [Amphimedon queenslandica]|uniref:G-patch domain-containing protein n=1 Tax=Amphimedon queenslandica TaxID=400682 RepID=A0A1X7VUC7_AMPQE|nr:PREDICTED: PIN2/TERF1-interacting telomerase inhibitor 1-like [Amphimedon queenslandica]|eukprot:XP_011410017.1 PREDICTED: PIN2/TERF1-interacting telomerase inhibitor 1-like [Amphimedon queenslandica]